MLELKAKCRAKFWGSAELYGSLTPEILSEIIRKLDKRNRRHPDSREYDVEFQNDGLKIGTDGVDPEFNVAVEDVLFCHIDKKKPDVMVFVIRARLSDDPVKIRLEAVVLQCQSEDDTMGLFKVYFEATRLVKSERYRNSVQEKGKRNSSDSSGVSDVSEDDTSSKSSANSSTSSGDKMGTEKPKYNLIKRTDSEGMTHLSIDGGEFGATKKLPQDIKENPIRHRVVVSHSEFSEQKAAVMEEFRARLSAVYGSEAEVTKLVIPSALQQIELLNEPKTPSPEPTKVSKPIKKIVITAETHQAIEKSLRNKTERISRETKTQERISRETKTQERIKEPKTVSEERIKHPKSVSEERIKQHSQERIKHPKMGHPKPRAMSPPPMVYHPPLPHNPLVCGKYIRVKVHPGIGGFLPPGIRPPYVRGRVVEDVNNNVRHHPPTGYVICAPPPPKWILAPPHQQMAPLVENKKQKCKIKSNPIHNPPMLHRYGYSDRYITTDNGAMTFAPSDMMRTAQISINKQPVRRNSTSSDSGGENRLLRSVMKKPKHNKSAEESSSTGESNSNSENKKNVKFVGCR